MSVETNTKKRQFGFRHWRISVKLVVVMLILIIVPLTIATIISSQTGGILLEYESSINLERLAFSTAQRIQQLINDNHQFIHFTTKNRDVIAYLSSSDDTQSDTVDVNYVIESMISSNEFINLASIFNDAGYVVAHSDPQFVGLNYLFRDYVQVALSGKEYTSGILVGNLSGIPGIISSAPVLDADKTVGVISTRIKGELIEEILKSTLNMESKDISPDELETIDIYLINEYGIVMSHSEENSDWLYKSLGQLPEDQMKTVLDVQILGSICPDGAASCDSNERLPRSPEALLALAPLREELLTSLDSRVSGNFNYCRSDNLLIPLADVNNCDGEWHVIGFSPVYSSSAPDASGLFMVVVDIPETVFLDGIETLIFNNVLVAVVMAVLGALVAFWVARMLAKPIKRVAQAAVAVENDRPFEPADIADVSSQGDEVGNLARVFSAMVMALRARMAELQTIYEIGQEISAGVDFEDTLKYILSSIRKVIPYEMAELSFYEESKRQMIVRTDADFVSSERETKIMYYEPETARSYNVDNGIMARLVSMGKALLIPNMTDDQDLEAGETRKWQDADAKSYLGVALKAKGKMIGAIELVNREPDQFNEDNARLLTSIAVQAAIEVQNALDMQARERQLEQQILNMEIVIDDENQQQQVEAITGRDFFKELKAKKPDK